LLRYNTGLGLKQRFNVIVLTARGPVGLDYYIKQATTGFQQPIYPDNWVSACFHWNI
jgi:hypothetical protein